MGPLALRPGLTLLVTVSFAVSITAASVLVANRIEADLVDDTRTSAEAVLIDYLETINGGSAGIGVVGEIDGTQFFYLDEEGERTHRARVLRNAP